MKHPWRLAEVNLKFVRKANYQVAVLPIGATEPHNLHLPYATDNYEVETVCDRACAYAWKKGGKAVLLPTIPYGADQNMMEFPFAMNVDGEVLYSIIENITRSLEHHGVKKLVVVNGHGGNSFRSGVRTLYRKYKVFVCVVNWYDAVSQECSKIFEHPGNHADEFETSLMMHLTPDLVNIKDADDGKIRPSKFDAGNEGWAWYPRPFDRLTTNSGIGYPKKATAAKGKKCLDLAEKKIGDFFVQLSKAKMDKKFPFK